MKLIIRRFQKEDEAAVLQLHCQALQAVGAYLEDDKLDEDLRQIGDVYLNGRGEFLVGEVDGCLVAMGAFRQTSETFAEIKRVRVHPDFQRQGFGQQIMDNLEAKAREFGYQKLHLDTTVQQIAAQKMYEKNGYIEVRRGKIAHFDCIFYEKAL